MKNEEPEFRSQNTVVSIQESEYSSQNSGGSIQESEFGRKGYPAMGLLKLFDFQKGSCRLQKVEGEDKRNSSFYLSPEYWRYK